LKGGREMSQDPNKLLDSILKNLDDLVNANKKETVLRLQHDINEAIKKTSENFRVRFSLTEQAAGKKNSQ